VAHRRRRPAAARRGTLISSIAVRRQGLNAEIAFFRWSVEGREGLGHYEVARADG